MKKRKPESVLGVLIGRAHTSSKAKSIAKWFSRCPYCLSCTNEENLIIGVLSIPSHHRWWLTSISKHPKETVGLQKAEVFFTRHMKAISKGISEQVKPVLRRAPCGADCHGCPVYHKKCRGCPATKYYTI